ncbi:membrane protein insertase YidC [Schleiferilactobacillus perolens]|uniref:Membrane insertase YidC/Oxa/ALB C-terminal domain-containing protein n=1 Tax=Schleiferilactobacillus perolens DSM 12744 TaxID=1423792 RepID=A0A0R1MXF7_9LACO|nr:membrane protein insertase YidC [Schleiferilactobacillus perolens]KRL12893.1 hypothetical protein FD09_GL002432 [Schleiferilactobacillus perolens DSM 12744]MCI1892512.1 membrane protein insertase YidC [Schleiferilactobacillus harbinensis]MCI1913587.1 membrane protein insertase YidC [Schleiferilactobacillus harbinensis]MCI2171856.1 membrane protein insertase YidC [Schleiferilactobacillus perolens]
MLKKKYIRYALILSSLVILVIVLSGCAPQGIQNYKAPTSGPWGWTYKYLAVPLQRFMYWCADLIGGPNGFGWGIVSLTLVIRLLLMPLMLRQQSNAAYQQEKMAAIQPQIQIIQKLNKQNLTMEQKQQLSAKQMELFQQNNVSMLGGIGCLPLLIQLPIMTALYQAIQFAPQIFNATFFGINLGQRNYVIAIVATLISLLQGWMMTIGVPAAQKKTMATTMLMSPLMTLFFTLFLPAGLGLYWLVGNLLFAFQQAITTWILQPRMRKRAARELKEHPIQQVVTEDMFGNMTAEAAANDPKVQEIHEKNRERNAGKQQRPRD